MDQKSQNQFFQILRRKLPSQSALVLFGVFLFFFLQGCEKKSSEDNFILITLDTQRADYISSYNPDNASTPNIDFLAQKGILYENCYSLIPITLPSHASLFFSTPPHEIKNYNNGQIIREKKKRPSLVTIFNKNGYSTAAFVSLGVLKSKFGLAEGFDFYKEDFPKGRWYLTAEEVNENVFPWLEQNHDQKFFLWIHYSDPHDPYAPPDTPPDLKLFLNNKLLGEYTLQKYSINEIDLNLKRGKNRIRFEVTNEFVETPNQFQARLDKLDFSVQPDEKDIEIDLSRGWFTRRRQGVFFFKKIAYIDIYNHSNPRQIKLAFRGKPLLRSDGVREFYKKEVNYMDGEIGRLWDKLKELYLFEKTHILVVGDHGEGLGEYANHRGDPHVGHIHYLYNIYMKVPFIYYNPMNSERSVRVKEPVTLLDIAPTIMKIMRFKNVPDFQGRNLLKLNKRKESLIFEETYKPEAVRNKFAIFQFPWHLILTPQDNTYEIFDIRNDPEEKQNLSEDRNLPSEVMDLKQKLDSFARKVLKGKEEIKIDEKTKEMLRALGYVK